MSIHKILLRSFSFSLLVFLLAGCKKFIEVQPPPSLLLSNVVFEDSNTAVAAINGVYQQMRDGGVLCGLVNNEMNFWADELVSYSSYPGGRELFYKNAILPSSEELSSLWAPTYTQLYAANSVIEGVGRSAGISTAFKDQLLGEALVIRSILHFYLVNLFGDIPYADTTDYLINTRRGRLAQSEVYKRIVADLEIAEAKLSPNYPSLERSRINRASAQALLARVHLYLRNWEDAAALATAVINQTSTYQMEDLAGAFLKESTETIWQFKSIAGTNSNEGAIGVRDVPPIPDGLAFSEHFLAAFESGDGRRTSWVGAVTDGSQTWYYPYKYKQKYNTTPSQEYSVVLRLAEQYLIRAEARSQLGQSTEALDDLNVIRMRAGLLPIEEGSSTEVLEAVYKERRVELLFEFSHRWYDLKRTNTAHAILSMVKPGWNATDTLLPIPEPELLINPNLQPQNPGYQ